MCKFLTKKNKYTCIFYCFWEKRLPFAQLCERNFGGIAVGKAASEVTTFF